MQMTDVRDKLQMLQEVLSEKYDIEKTVEEAPKRLSGQEGYVASEKKKYLEKNTVYEECKARVAELEVELREAEHSREEGEKGMDNIATHREYEALDKQITEATAKEAEVRKELDKERKTLNELNEDLKLSESLITSSEAELNVQKSSIDKEMAKLKTKLEKLEKKEAEITEGLDTEIVYKFQRIIQRNSEGIVAVKKNVCEGCHMILPAQFANEVHEGDKILFCPYCSRILFYQEVEGTEDEEYYAMAEAGSLSDYEDDFSDDVGEDNDEFAENDYNEKSSDYDEDVDDEDEDKDESEDDDDSDEN